MVWFVILLATHVGNRERNPMRTLCSLFALLSSSSIFGAVPIEGLYLNIFGGYSYLPSNVERSVPNTVLNVQELQGRYFLPPTNLLRTDPTYTNGYHGGGRVGYQIWPFQYEIEISYLAASVKQFKINEIRQWGSEGQSTGTFALGNLYYRFPALIPNISPFVSTGIGYGYVTSTLRSVRSKHPLDPRAVPQDYPFPAVPQNYPVSSIPTYYPGPLVPTYFRGADSVFAYQVSGGVNYDFSENYSINVAYRYIGTTSAPALGKNFQAHLASLGVTFRLDADNYR